VTGAAGSPAPSTRPAASGRPESSPRAAASAPKSTREELRRSTFPLPDLTWQPAREFWEGAAAHELRLPFCPACGEPVWYPRPCPACGIDRLVWRALSGRARLFSWTVVRRAFLPQYAEHLPLIVGLVVPAEAPTSRVATSLVDCDPEELRCDLPMEVTFRPLVYTGVGTCVAAMFRPAAVADR
jgi:uncharacterized OB-fold protein